MLSQYDRIGQEELTVAEEDAVSTQLSKRERRDAQNLVRCAYLEQDDKEFINRSGTAGIVLAAAFELLPNLQEVCITCDKDREDQRHTDFSATSAFSVISACLPFAAGKLQKLEFQWYLAGSSQGVSLQALCLPRQVLACFSATDPGKWKASASNFLANCPQLRELCLGFGEGWEETSIVFHHIAKKAVFQNLRTFKLEFLRCQGEDLLLFLGNHQYLHSLSLNDLDFTGTVAFKEILDHLQHRHRSLKSFRCRQIAQNGFRLFFEMYGPVECQESGKISMLSREDPDFYGDFLDVVGPFKYAGDAVEWEGVQDKIGVLKDDVRVSDRSYISDLAMYDTASYYWIE
ncbi:hypothetical protein TI39_contig331g00008 [Zymoseptoria brevis]|uniref:F-box domain-containing protein n=1 Tax=Zymoseptoria brevis TaxID=1047168 RepID=A0A0F4GSK0_9PEZI|nr:hypothetical protein TI39_contig331g00008 [Zymoseptoria brevis]